jgi:hypothetical protein
MPAFGPISTVLQMLTPWVSLPDKVKAAVAAAMKILRSIMKL